MDERSQDLKERVVLVTGAGAGLGAATCRVLAQAGATVIAADIDEEAAAATAADVEETGGRAVPYGLDVGDEHLTPRVVAHVEETLGRLDALINNAGVDVTVPIEEMRVEDWDRVIRINLRGPFLLSRAALPALRRAGGGHIVNVCSTAAKRTWANASAYHASKWGLLGFTHALHVEARPDNVKVTALVAGGMRTPFLLERFPDIDVDLLQDPHNVAETIRHVLTVPEGTVIPEVMVLPMRETSWP